jgi:DNA-binding phage protein
MKSPDEETDDTGKEHWPDAGANAGPAMMRSPTEEATETSPVAQTRVFELKDVISLLRSEIKRAGGQAAWARQTGISRTMLNKVLNGHKSPTMTIIAALKLRLVFVSDPNPPKRATTSPKRGKRGFRQLDRG